MDESEVWVDEVRKMDAMVSGHSSWLHSLHLVHSAILLELQRMESCFSPNGKGKLDYKLEVESFESRLIRMALRRTSGNRKIAARILRLNYTTLHAKIRKYQIGPDAWMKRPVVERGGHLNP
jgi:transcriptional regulator with PAS, ATPase and Fis domain